MFEIGKEKVEIGGWRVKIRERTAARRRLLTMETSLRVAPNVVSSQAPRGNLKDVSDCPPGPSYSTRRAGFARCVRLARKT